MEAPDQIRRFGEFLDKHYKAELLERVRKGEYFLVIDFTFLSSYDPELANDLLDSPEETIKAAEVAIEQFDLPEGIKHIHVRITNIPQNQKLLIRHIRSNHLGPLFVVEGIVRQKSDVRPQVTSARFECPSCGNTIPILQLDSAFREPTRCGCGRKGKFTLVSKELVDAQGIVLEEDPEQIEGGEQPKRINVLLKDDLVSPLSEKRTSPGSKVSVVGQIKEVPIILRSGGKSTRFDIIIEANYVTTSQESFYDVQVTKEQEDEIIKLSSDPKVYQKFMDAIAPSIYGHERIKEALVLQMFGGVQKQRKDGSITRGNIHVLLIGDPGSGKSQLLKRVSMVAPKSRYVSGKGVSAAGLTASVVRDEFLKGWSLEAGAMVLASNGMCMIDEMDKMSQEDTAAMHEAMESQTVSISKANIQATLISRTTVLAAANPKFGRFDPYDVLAKQIAMPPTLINRFDLLFPIKDLPDTANDTKLAGHILNLHQNAEIIEEPALDTKMVRKYISYARQHCRPQLTDGAMEEIKDYYVEMRNKEKVEEAASRAIPISPRQLEALVRLAEANAKVRLSQKVLKKDARKAIDLLHFCLSQVGVDPDTGKIDIDRLTTGISASQRGHIMTVKEILAELEAQVGKTIPLEEVERLATERDIDRAKLEEAIEKLKRSGDVFEPRHGFIQRI